MRLSVRRRVQNIPHSGDSNCQTEGGLNLRGGPAASQHAVHTAPAPAGRGQVEGDSSGARVGVLFSGGLDSVVLAAMLAYRGAEEGSVVPEGEPIDLINVCFDT